MAQSFVKIEFSDGFRRDFTFGDGDEAEKFANDLADCNHVVQAIFKRPGRPWRALKWVGTVAAQAAPSESD